MNRDNGGVRVLYSFPHKLGADRICYTAWQQVNGIAAAGGDLLVFPGGVTRPVPGGVKVKTTLGRGKIRVPYKVLGSMRAFALHDWIVSRRLERMAGKVDIVHTWPLGALRTLKMAAKLGIPTVLERPNAHTRFAYEVVDRECRRLGVILPSEHEHAYNEEVLRIEEMEYREAYRLLCPSDFVVRTFVEQGCNREKLVRHQYGFDESVYYPSLRPVVPNAGLKMLYVGGCAPRKGLHYALEAWLQSPARETGSFLIAGEFVPSYADKLTPMLADPSVKVLGFRNDVSELMRESDVLVLPTIEEGSALVTHEARGCGCVLLVSDAAGAICQHMDNALVHPVGDVNALAVHITMLDANRSLLTRLRSASLSTVAEISWTSAGRRLLGVYRETIAKYAEDHRIGRD